MPPGLAHRLLAALLIFGFGLVVGARYEPLDSFLERHLTELRDFIAGHPLERETTLRQKIEDDLGIAPWRSTRDASSRADFDYRRVSLAGDLALALPESELELYLRSDATALAGLAGMLVNTRIHAGKGYSPHLLLIGFDGVAYRAIAPGTRRECECSAALPLNYFHIAGDPAEARRAGNRLVNVDSCGRAVWEIESKYTFHHYLNNDGDHRRSAFWILDATDLVQIETASGRAVTRIPLGEIITANPDLHIFEARLESSRRNRWLYDSAEFTPLGRTHGKVSNADEDPFHTNDIDEYRGEPGLFERGDLLLSLRSLNLLVVVRPASRKVVWFAYGLTSRQHDPDFASPSSIMVYDNNFHNRASRIVTLEATSGAGEYKRFGATRRILLDRIDNNAFQQLTAGSQFSVADRRALILSAGHYSAGVDLDDGGTFLALRHRWRNEAFIDLEIERLLTPAEFDDIRNARCR